MKYNLAHIELPVIKAVLRMTKGNKALAAKVMGITVKTLYNKLHKNNLMEVFSSNNETSRTGEKSVTK